MSLAVLICTTLHQACVYTCFCLSLFWDYTAPWSFTQSCCLLCTPPLDECQQAISSKHPYLLHIETQDCHCPSLIYSSEAAFLHKRSDDSVCADIFLSFVTLSTQMQWWRALAISHPWHLWKLSPLLSQGGWGQRSYFWHLRKVWNGIWYGWLTLWLKIFCINVPYRFTVHSWLYISLNVIPVSKPRVIRVVIPVGFSGWKWGFKFLGKLDF